MYNILSLDGGGSWAIIQVMTLQRLYGDDAPGSHVLKNFDLVVANSGGSIVAAALFLDMKLSKIRQLFETRSERTKIFVSLPFGPITHELGIGPRYDAAAKLKGLRAVFGADSGIKLNDAADKINKLNKKEKRTELVIVGYQYDRERAKFFRSNPASLASGSGSTAAVTLAEAVHASSNAPINYFDKPANVRIDNRDVQFWDGAITGFNNPVMAGVIEAKANGIANADIHVLSIGTGNTFLPLVDLKSAEHKILVAQPEKSDLPNDLQKLASSILADPPDAASFIAHVMLDGKISGNAARPVTTGPIVRLNPLIQPVLASRDGSDFWILPRTVRGPDHTWGQFPRDAQPALDKDRFEALVKMDMDAVEDKEVRLIREFAQLWMDDHIPNQSVRVDGRLDCQIGHRWFSQGLSQAIDYFGPVEQRAVA
ncbi:MAG TPA: patatin-like phospholipase family protein [Dongiaceae bacterium]|nr:patatin-like phospholipase family protein [Dongiaceae bacterium]